MSDEEIQEQLSFTHSNYVRGERQWRPQISVTFDNQSIEINITCSIIIQDFDQLTVQHYVDVPTHLISTYQIRSIIVFWLICSWPTGDDAWTAFAIAQLIGPKNRMKRNVRHILCTSVILPPHQRSAVVWMNWMIWLNRPVLTRYSRSLLTEISLGKCTITLTAPAATTSKPTKPTVSKANWTRDWKELQGKRCLSGWFSTLSWAAAEVAESVVRRSVKTTKRGTIYVAAATPSFAGRSTRTSPVNAVSEPTRTMDWLTLIQHGWIPPVRDWRWPVKSSTNRPTIPSSSIRRVKGSMPANMK